MFVGSWDKQRNPSILLDKWPLTINSLKEKRPKQLEMLAELEKKLLPQHKTDAAEHSRDRRLGAELSIDVGSIVRPLLLDEVRLLEDLHDDGFDAYLGSPPPPPLLRGFW